MQYAQAACSRVRVKWERLQCRGWLGLEGCSCGRVQLLVVAFTHCVVDVLPLIDYIFDCVIIASVCGSQTYTHTHTLTKLHPAQPISNSVTPLYNDQKPQVVLEDDEEDVV